tara:strand:+ start:1038 stop:2279 length:1242 start_codon:yes stop_codon:yes gene_type:complete
MKNKVYSKILLVFMVLIIINILLTGCVPQAGEVPEEVHKGTEGLRMEFLENNPPNKITAATGNEINVAIQLENKGTAPVQGLLYLRGFDPAIVHLGDTYRIPDPNDCGSLQIEPRSKYNRAGGVCVMEMVGLLNLNHVPDYIDIPLMATAVYQYYTDSSVMVCVDPFPNRLGKKACQMRDVSVSGGQGAPLAITKVEPIPVGRGKVQYQIHISNQDNGQIVNPRIHPVLLRPRDYNYVNYAISVPGSAVPIQGSAIEGFELGYQGEQLTYNNDGDSWRYTSDNNRITYDDGKWEIIIGGNFNTQAVGKVRLHNGKAVITQTIDFGDKAFEYVTPLRITLGYAYMQDIQKTVRINKVPGEYDELYPGFGFAGHELYPINFGGQRYIGYYEDPYGHDALRYIDRKKGINFGFVTT